MGVEVKESKTTVSAEPQDTDKKEDVIGEIVTTFKNGQNTGTTMRGDLSTVDPIHLVGAVVSSGTVIMLQQMAVIMQSIEKLTQAHNNVAALVGAWRDEEEAQKAKSEPVH